MEGHEEIIDLLRRIEQNQQKALQAQERHLALAQAQLDRSNHDITQSIDLQRVGLARQAQIRNIVLPIIGILVLVLVYLLFR